MTESEQIAQLRAERDRYKAELVSYHRMAAAGVWLTSKELVKKLEDCDRYKTALEAIAQDGWICGEKTHGPYKGLTEAQIAAVALHPSPTPKGGEHG